MKLDPATMAPSSRRGPPSRGLLSTLVGVTLSAAAAGGGAQTPSPPPSSIAPAGYVSPAPESRRAIVFAGWRDASLELRFDRVDRGGDAWPAPSSCRIPCRRDLVPGLYSLTVNSRDGRRLRRDIRLDPGQSLQLRIRPPSSRASGIALVVVSSIFLQGTIPLMAGAVSLGSHTGWFSSFSHQIAAGLGVGAGVSAVLGVSLLVSGIANLRNAEGSITRDEPAGSARGPVDFAFSFSPGGASAHVGVAF